MKYKNNLRKPFFAVKKLFPKSKHAESGFLHYKIPLILIGVAAISAVVFAVRVFHDEVQATDFLPVTFSQPDPVLSAEIETLVKGYPIEAMIPSIARQDRQVAAYLVSIAKKESDWGRRVPRLDGRDCFNYWGFRAVSEEMGTDGHTCFKNPRQAVRSVSKRLRELVYEEKRDSPEKLIVWKCGFSCAGHSTESVKKWVSDVAYYYRALEPGKSDIP